MTTATHSLPDWCQPKSAFDAEYDRQEQSNEALSKKLKAIAGRAHAAALVAMRQHEASFDCHHIKCAGNANQTAEEYFLSCIEETLIEAPHLPIPVDVAAAAE